MSRAPLSYGLGPNDGAGRASAVSSEGYESVSGAVNSLRAVGAILVFGALEVEAH